MTRTIIALALFLATVAAALAQSPPNQTPAAGTTAASAQTSCGTTATLLLAADSSKTTRQVSNQSGATVFLGASTVTTSTGYAMATATQLDASRLNGPLYCVAVSAETVSTLQY